MNNRLLVNKMLASAGLFFLMGILHATSATVWTFLPLTPTSVSISAMESVTVQYTVTNQSRKPRILKMTPITGISQVTTGAGVCDNSFTLGYQQSCVLSLNINGQRLQGNVDVGPVVCDQSTSPECYQPSQTNHLNITLTTSPLQLFGR